MMNLTIICSILVACTFKFLEIPINSYECEIIEVRSMYTNNLKIYFQLPYNQIYTNKPNFVDMYV